MAHLPRTSMLATLLALILAACSAGQASDEPVEKPRVGLFSSIPIYWGEGDFGEMLDGAAGKDWVRAELETRIELVPLDTLEAEGLAGLERVILAQPRPLAPSENVAFDRWLAEGGQAVILADPMLTRHSRYPLGDRRRPQDVVVLSPILAHWGLELRFDEDQPGGERTVAIQGDNVPVNLHGHFVAKGEGDAGRTCVIEDDGLIARCRVGDGEAVLLADAALLDAEHDGAVSAQRQAGLWSLLGPLAAPEPAAAD